MTDMPEEIWAYRDEFFDHKWNFTSVVESTKYTRSDISEKIIATLEQQLKKMHEMVYDADQVRAIQIGRYLVSDCSENEFKIVLINGGEGGCFKEADLETVIDRFYRENF